MSEKSTAIVLVFGFLTGIVLLLAIGQRLGRKAIARETDAAGARLTAVEAAIFGLMGLMVAFTFSGAADRYELRRQLVVEEANAIGTAYLRLDMLSAIRQSALREQFRRYVQTRIAVYRLLPDVEAATAQADLASALQKDMWGAILAALAESPPHVALLVIPALNHMIDITTRRTLAASTHTPHIIFGMLVMLALVSSLLAGYIMASNDSRRIDLHRLAFSVVMTATIYMIFDLDYPRFGLIRLDFADQALLDVLTSMK